MEPVLFFLASCKKMFFKYRLKKGLCSPSPRLRLNRRTVVLRISCTCLRIQSYNWSRVNWRPRGIEKNVLSISPELVRGAFPGRASNGLTRVFRRYCRRGHFQSHVINKSLHFSVGMFDCILKIFRDQDSAGSTCTISRSGLWIAAIVGSLRANFQSSDLPKFKSITKVS
jgi:hypothetical protein